MKLHILFGTFFVLIREGNLMSATFQSYKNFVEQQLDRGETRSPQGSESTATTSFPADIAANSRPINVVQGLVARALGIGSSNNVLTRQVIIRRGVNCGYVSLNNGDNLQITSRNYNVSNYFNNEACTWRFEANRCTLSVACPCVDFPASPFCFDDYLRVTDKFNFDQKYCGSNKPVTPLVSTSHSLMVKYRTNGRGTATGFVCFVSCYAPPVTSPPLVEAYKCPNPSATTI